MPTSEAAGLDLFTTMEVIWRDHVPPDLVGESPNTVTRILELGLVTPGMSHTDMRQAVGLDQPDMSRIAKKLVKAGWIRIAQSEVDRRARLITVTDAGRNLLSSLKDDLNVSMLNKAAEASPRQLKPYRPARQSRGKLQQEGMTPFDFPDAETEVTQS